VVESSSDLFSRRLVVGAGKRIRFTLLFLRGRGIKLNLGLFIMLLASCSLLMFFSLEAANEIGIVIGGFGGMTYPVEVTTLLPSSNLLDLPVGVSFILHDVRI
jgi:hypothetical protein